MSTDVLMRVMPGGLVAVNPVEAEKLEPLLGQELMASLKAPRNIRFHRKYWALLGVALDMADTDWNLEQFRAFVTVGAGYCEFLMDSEGAALAIPRSISFAAMDETEFERLYQDTLTFICRKWVLDAEQIDKLVGFM